jgi:hypothetical protein
MAPEHSTPGCSEGSSSSSSSCCVAVLQPAPAAPPGLQVQLYTLPEHVQSTSVQKNTLEPIWNEHFYVVIQVGAAGRSS